MGQPTEISVLTDSSEYSRYEDSRNTVNVTVQISGGGPYSGEAVLVELVKARRSRDAVVGTANLTFNGASPQVGSASFNLVDLVDQDMLNLVRHGKYFIRARSVATSAEAVIGSGTATPITLETVDTGTDANSWTATVVVPGGTSPLMVTVVGTSVTVSLATAAGVPIPAQNTRELISATINSNYANVLRATWSGTAGLSLSAAEGPVAFSGGRDEVAGESSDFDIRIVTVARLKSEFLFGIPLQAGMARMARNQPVNISGVTITEVSSNHPMGVYTLGYTYAVDGANTIRQLSWNGGPLVSVSSPGQYILRRGNGTGGSGANCGGSSGLLSSILGNDFIVVKVDGPTFLPAASTSDEILVDQLRLDDSALAKYLSQAESWLENVALAIYLEPTNVVTDRDPTMIQFAAGINAPTPLFTDPDYDFIVGPLTYYPPRAGGEWVDIQTPYPQILRIDSLFGSIANTRVIDIDLDWIQAYPQGGLIQLVPFNQTIAFDFLGLIWVNALRGSAAIPNFWHFNFMVGLRDCPPDLQELIAKKAAMDALTMLGAALRPGVGSTSLGRDGVSQSVSYTTQMKYGPYTGAITAFKEWIDENLVKYRGKYRGATLVVV